jgi:hypothetical protein
MSDEGIVAPKAGTSPGLRPAEVICIFRGIEPTRIEVTLLGSSMIAGTWADGSGLFCMAGEDMAL